MNWFILPTNHQCLRNVIVSLLACWCYHWAQSIAVSEASPYLMFWTLQFSCNSYKHHVPTYWLVNWTSADYYDITTLLPCHLCQQLSGFMTLLLAHVTPNICHWIAVPHTTRTLFTFIIFEFICCFNYWNDFELMNQPTKDTAAMCNPVDSLHPTQCNGSLNQQIHSHSFIPHVCCCTEPHSTFAELCWHIRESRRLCGERIWRSNGYMLAVPSQHLVSD